MRASKNGSDKRAANLLQLEEVYGEVFRVLKPGSYFASYEWVATKEYDPSNPEHVRIMDEINFGNGLPVISCPAMLCMLLPCGPTVGLHS